MAYEEVLLGGYDEVLWGGYEEVLLGGLWGGIIGGLWWGIIFWELTQQHLHISQDVNEHPVLWIWIQDQQFPTSYRDYDPNCT